MLKAQFLKLSIFVLVGAVLNRFAQAVRCINDHMPVCARYGHEYLLFANKCDLLVAKREQLLGILNEVPLRFCVVSCEFTCSLHDEEPICGINTITGERKTFNNRCELARMSCLSNSHWKFHQIGICSTAPKSIPKKVLLTKPKKKQQPLPCTGVYKPVCATYAAVKSTFDNECFVNAENINTGKNWRVISQGICAEDQNSESYQKWQASVQRNKLTNTLHTNAMDRTKRSITTENSEYNNFELDENTVYIYAPNAFETQFINSDGKIEKNYLDLGVKQPSAIGGVRQTATKLKGTDQSKVTSQTMQNDKKLSKPKMTEPCKYGTESVCGTFNKENRNFTDVCALMDHSQRTGNDWNILHQGLCRQCQHDCEAKYEPLCVNRSGLNYTLFNECYLKRIKCLDPKSIWKVVGVGECLTNPDEDLKEKYMTKPPGFYFTSHYVGGDEINGWELSVPKDLEKNFKSSTTTKTISTSPRSASQLTTITVRTAKKNTATKPLEPTAASKSKIYFKIKTTTPKTSTTTAPTPTTTPAITTTLKPIKWYHFIKNEADTLTWKSSERASIYGAESNSAIMRLARAKSRRNDE